MELVVIMKRMSAVSSERVSSNLSKLDRFCNQPGFFICSKRVDMQSISCLVVNVWSDILGQGLAALDAPHLGDIFR